MRPCLMSTPAVPKLNNRLAMAVRAGDGAAVASLLEMGADPNFKAAHGGRGGPRLGGGPQPMAAIAAFRGDGRCLELLARRGADVSAAGVALLRERAESAVELMFAMELDWGAGAAAASGMARSMGLDFWAARIEAAAERQAIGRAARGAEPGGSAMKARL